MLKTKSTAKKYFTVSTTAVSDNKLTTLINRFKLSQQYICFLESKLYNEWQGDKKIKTSRDTINSSKCGL